VVTRKSLFPLPRAVYVLQAGLVLNAFGNGAANPFLLVYLHRERGIPLALAGLVSLTAASCALAASLVSGTVADRVGARAAMTGGLALSAAGFALYPLVQTLGQAIPVAVLAGSGIGAWLTGQSALLAAVTPSPLRPLAFAQQRVAANLGLGLGGFVGGLVVAGAGFTALFLLNALTFVAYALVLRLVPDGRPARGAVSGGYREVLRDRPFLALVGINFAVVAAAVALLNGIVPVFALEQAGIDARAIGGLFLLNSLTIIVCQIPAARLQEGRRRAVALAQMCGLFAAAWLLVLAAGLSTKDAALAVLVAAILVYSLAECLYDAVQGPLTADLAREHATGRYLATIGFSWQLGFVVGPALAAVLLGAAPLVLWPAAAAVCAAAGLAVLRLERRLPADVRRTPVREHPLPSG